MRKRKINQPLLFPGYLLNERCKTIQFGACTCGYVFECISEEALKATRLQIDSTENACPDLRNTDSLFESKCFGTKSHRDSRCLVHQEQLEEYVKMNENMSYVFWAYNKGFQLDKNTRIGSLVQSISTTIEYGLVLDIQIVRTMFSYIGQISGLGFRHAKLYFQGRPTIIRNYLVISKRFFDGLITIPAMTISNLGMNYNEFEHSQKLRRITFEYNGVKFKTNTFRLHKILPRIPF